MRKINENQKITLTLGQLKKLIKESSSDIVTPEIKKNVEKYVIFAWKKRNGDEHALSPRDIYDLAEFQKKNGIVIGDDDVKINGEKVANIERRYSSRRINFEYKELRPKIEWLK